MTITIQLVPARRIKDEDDVLWHGGKVLRSHKVDEVPIHELDLLLIH